MANINIKKGSYANKANLKENGDIGFAKYNSNTGTIIINDGGTLVNLMPAPGVANKPLVGQGDSSAPTYKTLPIAGGGTGTDSITAGKVPFVLNNVFTASKHSIDQNRLSINADLKDSIALYVNGSSSFSNDIIVGNLSASKRGTVRHFRPTYNWEKSKSDGYLFDLGPRTNATMVMIHVLGNGYNGQQAPINSMYQFYNYPSSWDTAYLGILSASGRCYGYDTGSLYVYNRGDNIYAYLECKGSAQTVSFSVYLNASVITPSVYPILKQEIPTFLTEDPDNVVEIVGRTFAKVTEGGTGSNSFTANRLLFYDGTQYKITSSNNYISASQLAINATAMPANTTFNLYVNGSAKINNLVVPIKSLSWINGKDTSNASIAVETKMTNGNYHSILGIKTNKEHTISLGGIYDEIGFFTYKSNRTANGSDYRLSIDAETGYVKLGGHSTFATLIGPSVAGTFKFPDIGGTFVTHETKGTAVGSAEVPVYINANGRATQISITNSTNGNLSSSSSKLVTEKTVNAAIEKKAAIKFITWGEDDTYATIDG